MSIIKPPQIDQISNKINMLDNKIHVIIGPRQVGKTTTIKEFIKKNNQKSSYITADGAILRDPSWLKIKWDESIQNGVDILIIDEIQKVENWSETVKLIWEKREEAQPKLILLGSSSLALNKGLSESLAGRFVLHRVMHWDYENSNRLYEMSFEDYLKYGGYPGSYELLDMKDEWLDYIKSSIVDSVIGKDILTLINVKSPALFRQAFDLICSHAAQEISYTKLLGQLQDKGNTDLVKHYIELFEAAFLIKKLEKYSGSVLRIKSSSPKLVPLCPALFSASIDLDFREDDYGRAFEIVVCNELLKLPGKLYYWRERNAEVDYVYKEGRELHAIEVKYKKSRGASGLGKFAKKYPDAKLHIVTSENYKDIIDKISKLK